MDRVDGGLGIIVEKRNDFVRTDVFGDRGRAAQVGKPQHRVDALGHAARYPAAQHLLGGVAPEIDPAQRSRDIDLGGGFDREPQHRHEVAQRRQALLAETVGTPGQPVGIDAVHLADGSGFTEPMHERHEMTVAFCGELVDRREVERGAIGEIDPQFVMAVLEHVKEGRAPPVLRRIALPVGPYSKLSLSLVSVSFQRNPRPSKIGCSVSMKTSPRDRSRPSARQRSQKPRTRSFSARPVRPWLTSQFISLRRGARSISGPYGGMPRSRATAAANH